MKLTTVVLAAALLLAPLNAAPFQQQPASDATPDGKGDRTRNVPGRAASSGGTAGTNGISYHGGPVMLGTTKIYYIWYGNWSSGNGPTSVDILTTLARNIGGSPYFNINTTYFDSQSRAVSNSVSYVSSTTDNYSFGTSLSDGNIASIVSNAISSGALPNDPNGIYFVLTSADVTATSGFCTQYCGWHDFQTVQGTNIKYAFIGNADRCPSACAAQSPGPNGTTGADAMASIISHELEEAVTDPFLNAWYDSAGNENADKCAWTFGTTYSATNGATANMFLGGRDYLIQRNWVNASGGYCALSYASSPDFTLSAAPSSQTVAPGGGTAYTVTVTPTNGFSGSVNLSVSGLPSGASASFSANPATSTSTLTITTTGATPTGSFPLTITGTNASLSHTAGVTLNVSLPPDFSFTATPPTNTAVVGSSASFTATVSALNGFTGTTSFAVSGLPSGVTAGFSPSTVTGSGSSTLTLTTAANTVPGTYPLTITATSGALNHTAGISLIVTLPVTGGTLSGSMGSVPRTVQLTQLGTLDWAHWGINTVSDFDHKAGVTSQIPNFTQVGSVAASRYANNSAGFTWTDGTPTASATSTTTGVYISGQGNGFKLVVPADTTVRTLLVYVGAWHTQLKMVAQLSDGSAPTYTDTSLVNTVSPTSLGVYTFTYNAASANQTLTLTFTQNLSGTGNVTLQAAALSGGALSPDFTLSAAPSSPSVVVGQSVPVTATVSPLNGFTGSVGLAVSGLPTGVTASFSPTSVTGSGTSILTLTAAANTVGGVYPITMTGTSGALTHTANLSLTVSDFSISATPASQTVAAGQNAPYTTTVTAVSGFAGTVGLTVSGLPTGVTAAFSPTSVTGSGTSTMTLTVAANTAPGTYPLAVTGTSGSLTHTAGVSLTVTAAPDFSLSATPSSQTVIVGQSAPYTATVTALNGFTGATSFTVSGLPTGVTAAFSPASVTGGGTSTLTLSAATNTVAGVYPLTITGTSGTLTHTANISLTVTDFSLTAAPASQTVTAGQNAPYTATVTALSGFAGTVGLTVSGLPTGVTAAFSPTSVTGSGTSTMTLTVAANTTPGTYPLTVSGTSGSLTHTAGVSLTVNAAPDFSLTATPSTQTVIAGQSAPYTATVTALNGFTGTASFTVSGLPSGVTAVFSPASVTGSGTSTLTLSAATNTVAGVYPLTITGTSGTLTHTANISLTVTDFSLSATPASQTVTAGQNAPYTATVTALSGFAGTVGLTVSGLPSGVSAAFSPTSVTGGGTSTMTLTVAANTAPGTYPLTVTGTSGSLTHTAGVSLTVNAAPDFSLSATPSSQTVVAGLSAPYTATVTALNGFTGTTAFTVSGLPSGVTAAFSPASVTGSGSSAMTLTVAGTTVPGTYSLTVTGTSASLIHTAGVSLTVTAAPDFTLSATPGTQTVVAGQAAPYTATIGGLNGFAGSVGFSVSGLPAGVTAAFSPATVTASGSSTMTLTVPAATVAGVYPLTITATSGVLAHTANVSLTVTQPVSGLLTGSMAPPTGPVQLTTEGALDWAHWGINTVTDFDRKASVTPQISNYSVVGSGTVTRYSNNSVGFTWTDGTPTVSATNTTTGIFISGQNNGFRITVPADTTTRTLKVYVGAFLNQLRMQVHLSDNSAADYVDTSLVNTVRPTSLGVFTLTFRAASPGQTLTVTLTQNQAGVGNVTLQAATLQ